MFLARWFYILRLRMRSLFRRDRAEDELAEEIRFHLEARERDFVARGMTATDARQAALRAFGGVEQRKEECRDTRRVGWLEDFVKDVAYAARVMRRSPLFTAVAVLSLAIGIGASTAIFSIFDALVLRPLPVDRPGELRTARVVARIASGRVAKSTPSLPYRVFRDIHTDHAVFGELLAFSRMDEPVVGDGTRILRTGGGGLSVSLNYFSMLGVRPRLGRLFGPGSGSSADRVVVLSDRFWRREFAADPGILEKSLRINGQPFVVVGVAPPPFFGLAIGRTPDFFVPIDSNETANYGVQIVGRVNASASDEAAAEWLTAALTHATGVVMPGLPAPMAEVLPVDTGLSEVRERVAEPLSILMIMVAVLLLVAAANVATMLLARGSARRTEMVIRASVGAGRTRLLRQLATESLLLLTLATAGGVLLASWGTRALVSLMQYLDAPLSLETFMDTRILIFIVGACAVVGVITSLVPALYVSRYEAAGALKERHESAALSHESRLGKVFVIGQVALSLTLVAAAVLLARTLYALTTFDAGFNSTGVVLATVNPGARAYDRPALGSYYPRVSERLRQLPGIERASLVQFSFLTAARTTGTFLAPGYDPPADDDHLVQVFQVGADFFGTMRIPIVSGRDFTEGDMTAEVPSVAINESMARRFFGTLDPLGRIVTNPTTGRQLRVIAVVKDGRYNSLREPMSSVIFVPYPSAGRPRMTYVVRLAGHAGASTTLQRIESEVRAIDPLVPVQIEPLDSAVARSLGQERLVASIAAFFAIVALLLLALGLYGLMGYWVTARTAEIGVRLALGAQRSQVVWNVVRPPLLLLAVGLSIGVGLTIAGARFVSHLLFGLVPEDPATLAAATVCLIGVAAMAAVFPARRATRVDPVVALRCE